MKKRLITLAITIFIAEKQIAYLELRQNYLYSKGVKLSSPRFIRITDRLVRKKTVKTGAEKEYLAIYSEMVGRKFQVKPE